MYPLYFDAGRTRAEGRRVGKELAVENPLAREIVDAVQLLGLNVVFEPGKLHPKDWANPGRVRTLIKEDGRVKNPNVNNSKLSLLVPAAATPVVHYLRLLTHPSRASPLHARGETPPSTSHHARLPDAPPYSRHACTR